jgi:hypothetical protein
MGDHTYKKIVAGNYVRSDGVEILKHDAGGWRAYLPLPAAGGQQMIGIRPTLRQAKEAAEHHMRLAVDSAHAHAISEYFDRELEATATARSARSAEADTRTAKYDALQRDLAAALAAVPDSIRPDVYLEVAPDVFDLLGVPFPERLRGSRATYAGRPVGIDTDLEPSAWRMRAFLLGTVAHSQLDARAILRRVLAEIDLAETGDAGSVRHGQAVLAVKLVAAELGVEL